MSGHERDKQTLEELDMARVNNPAKDQETITQQYAALPQPTPQEAFKQLITDLQSALRQQQLKNEQSIQQTLQQAATFLGDAEKIDCMSKLIQTLQQATTQQGPANNPQFYRQMLQQLSTAVQEQLHRSEQQVAQALQQTVGSMAQSQAAMFDSQSFARMAETLQQCQQSLQQWQTSPQGNIH